jgi:hypothetical protein
MNIIFTLLLAGLFSFSGAEKTSPRENSCNNLENTLGGRFEAIEKIQNADFDFIQEFQTLNLMGVRKATFYSCGAGNGYLIVETNRQPEVYRNVPRNLWEEWKISYNIDYFYQRILRNNSLYKVW